MTLDPLTFGFEILNFLVLLWLLQRFLYKPVRAAIAQRQATLEQALKDAQAREQSAVAREQEQQRMQQAWDAEKARLQTALHQSLALEREQVVLKVRAAADAEKARLQTLLEQDQSALEQRTRALAVDAALQLARRLLERLAGTDLDQALLTVLQEDLARLPSADQEALGAALRQQQGQVIVASAHPLSADQLRSLQAALATFLGQAVQCETALDPQLISGVRISIGARVLHANLGDELDFFRADMNHDTH